MSYAPRVEHIADFQTLFPDEAPPLIMAAFLIGKFPDFRIGVIVPSDEEESFESFKELLASEVYQEVFPELRVVTSRRRELVVNRTIQSPDASVLFASAEGSTVGGQFDVLIFSRFGIDGAGGAGDMPYETLGKFFDRLVAGGQVVHYPFD